MSAALWVSEDLTEARLLARDGSHAWVAQRDDEGALADDVRTRVANVSAFVRENLRKAGGRLGTVILGVDDSRCIWITSPSAEPAVLAAAMRKRSAEWEGGRLTATVQPLALPPEKESTLARLRKKPEERIRPGAAHVAVLETHDGPLRLLLHDLDRAGTRPAQVLSHWHALCAAFAQDAPADHARAIVSLHPESRRIVWAWSAEGRLLAGGGTFAAVITEEDGDPAFETGAAIGRLALDWLTWGAQLGATPDSIHVVGPGAGDFKTELQGRFKDVGIESIDADHAFDALLERMAEGATRADPDGDDPRRVLVGATERASVMQRRLLLVASLAVAIAGVGAGAIGYRGMQLAGDMRDQASAFRVQSEDAVIAIAPQWAGPQRTLLRARDLRRQMESELAAIRIANPPLEEPRGAAPIFDEAMRFLTAITQVEDAELRSLDINDPGMRIQRQTEVQAQVNTPGFRAGERLQELLEEGEDRLSWQPQSRGTPPNVQWTFRGTWTIDQ